MNRSSPIIPGTALVLCLVGVLGLLLPLVRVGIVGISVTDFPVFGAVSVILFAGLTLLPVADLVTRDVFWTRWLVGPTALALLPASVLLIATGWIADVIALLTGLVGARSVEGGIGAGGVMLLVAEFGLLGTSIAAMVVAREDHPESTELLPPPLPPRPAGPSSDPDL